MAPEKATTIYMEKLPFAEKEKKKKCSRVVISWICGVLLAIMLVILTITFLIDPETDKRCYNCVEDIDIHEVKVVEKKTSPPVATDYISEDLHKIGPKNLWDLEYLIDPTQLCATRNPPESDQYDKDPEVKLLVLVTSEVGHFVERVAIRRTWGSVADNPLGPIRLGFVLGTTKNETESRLLREESISHKDIIQADFVENSKQTTTKSVLMLQWVSKRCPHAQYFLKADDDTFVNVGILAKILGSEPFVSKEKFIGGYVHNKTFTKKEDVESYYFKNDYSGSYASGSAYVMPGPTALELFDACRVVQPMLPFEDVFITGICGKRIDAPLIHDSRFICEKPAFHPSWPAFSSLATVHGVTPDALQQVWDDMTRSIFNQMFHHDLSLNNAFKLRRKNISM